MKSFIEFTKQITFPSKKQLVTNLLNVAMFSAIIGAFVCIADYAALSVVQLLLSVLSQNI